MSKPIWITPSGSLGVIPEGVFYQQALRAYTEPFSNTPTCTSTSASNNAITCSSTAGVYAGLAVEFTGTTFGGLYENTRYFVVEVLNSTQFTIADTEFDTTPKSLTDGTGSMTAIFSQHVYYRLIAGTLPSGLQVADNGMLVGVPQAVASLQGVPSAVSTDVTSKFAIRGYTLTQAGAVDGIGDRTFSITVTGNDVPNFTTPAGNIGTYYDGDYVNLQIGYVNADAADTITVSLVSGELPLGLRMDSTGLIKGFIRPAPNEDQPVGYDETPSGSAPYDFVSAAISKNYQFTLEISDGKSNNLRTFTIFVYNRADLTADDTYITADTTFVTADQTPERYPFLLNFEPTSLGRVRSDNNFAYRFIGQDYDNTPVKYAFSVNQGFGAPPGLVLDPSSGWYYGFIPDQGVTEIDYSFNITVYQASFFGTPITCTNTTGATNIITCDSTLQLAPGQPIVFTGTGFGGITASPTTIYYVLDVFGALGTTQFTVATSPTSTSPVLLTTATGTMQANLIIASAPYPFTITITGNIESEVTWLSPAYLGDIENGATSMFKVEAVNTGGRALSYRLKDGAFNELPQGLKLLPSGEIAGRVTFNTFAIDLGSTTFDSTQNNITGIDPTTFDSTFVFTVNAYAEDATQPLYDLSEVIIEDGGTGYTVAPVIQFEEPVGATAEIAVVEASVAAGAISAITVVNPGSGYTTDSPSYSVIGDGSGESLQVVMQQTGFRDIISVYKTFTIRVIRAYNKPYQNLFVLAMPPQNDRDLLNNLLTDENIFIPSAIYRPDDPNFGLSTSVKYQHAFGLDPVTFETYVSSLYENHYWKNLVLGSIETAQAIDPVTGEVVYEVVYSKIVDDLVNSAGESVSKSVALPYAIDVDGTTVNVVYPNSLVDMRNQVIDTVGQLSTQLPLWMSSKQSNGRVLGFTPAWVICYTNPGESARIAYYIDSQFGVQLNKIDFKVDRYILDSTLSKNWDPVNQSWAPTPSLTTFDRVDTLGYADIGEVNACTELAFADVNLRNIDYINSLGGLDGPTWIAVAGQTPPVGTRVIITDGSKIAFVKQEAFIGPSGSVFDSANDAFADYSNPYDSTTFDNANAVGIAGTFDYGPPLNSGYAINCTETVDIPDTIICDGTLGMTVGNKVWFTDGAFGGLHEKTNGFVQVYYVKSVTGLACTATAAGTNIITCSSTAKLTLGQQVWFKSNVVNATATQTTGSGDNTITCSSITNLAVGQPIVFYGTGFGNIVESTKYYILSIDSTSNKITISSTYMGSEVVLTDDTGSLYFTAGGAYGNINESTLSGLPKPYYVIDIPSGTGVVLSEEPDGDAVSLTSANGVMTMYIGEFQVSTSLGGTAVPLTNATGSMTANYGNERMSIYTVSIGPDNVVSLSLYSETVTDDYITSTQGQKYTAGTYLYRPATPQKDLVYVNWQPLITATTVVTQETVFDAGSVQWVDPVDMYNPTDSQDKYLVFPKTNILV